MKTGHSRPSLNQLSQQNLPIGNKVTRVWKSPFRGFSGEATVSVLFRVRLALGSQLRDGGVLIVSNPIILPVQIRRSSVFLTKNLTSSESCETLVFRHRQVIESIEACNDRKPPMLLPNNELR